MDDNDLEETEEIFVELVAGAAVLQHRDAELFNKFFDVVSTLNKNGGLRSTETKVQTHVPTDQEVTEADKSR